MLLPVLPLFIQDQGIDPAQLGIIIAAWPIAKLMFEPVFGWTADRGHRKPQMVAGLVILAVASVLPLILTSFAWLFVLRFIAGMATAMYDPAARGIVVDATHDDERGEAFGYYGAFQIGGLAFGPADIVSCTPSGTARSGTLYLRSRHGDGAAIVGYRQGNRKNVGPGERRKYVVRVLFG